MKAVITTVCLFAVKVQVSAAINGTAGESVNTNAPVYALSSMQCEQPHELSMNHTALCVCVECVCVCVCVHACMCVHVHVCVCVCVCVCVSV